MTLVMYTGPGYVRELWGVEFPANVPVDVTDPALVHKVGFLDHFVVLGNQEPVSSLAAEPVGEAPQKIAEIAPGVPAGWEGLHWKQRMKLAKDLMGAEAANGTEADEAIRAYLGV